MFPRVAVLLIWLARPTMFSAAFGGSWFWPLLGVLFLPFTTLMYVLIWSGGGVAGWDWLWVSMGALLDLTHYAGSLYGGRDRLPVYASRITQ
ncbi:MAG: hypothetical protein HGA45_30445 [Chloroflexales bacterium]|nr:hypothetical protein [Chloroflexales bacterium]